MCVLKWIYYSCVPGTVIFCNHTFLLLARYVLFFWLALKGFCKAKSFAEVSDWISPLLRFLLLRSDCIQRSFCRHPINKDPGQQRKMKPKVAYSIGIQKNHPTSAYDWYPAAKILDCLVEIGCWPTPLNDTPWRPHRFKRVSSPTWPRIVDVPRKKRESYIHPNTNKTHKPRL